MQLELQMADLPKSITSVWATLNEHQRTEVLEVLARLIANTAKAQLAQEDDTHERS